MGNLLLSRDQIIEKNYNNIIDILDDKLFDLGAEAKLTNNMTKKIINELEERNSTRDKIISLVKDKRRLTNYLHVISTEAEKIKDLKNDLKIKFNTRDTNIFLNDIGKLYNKINTYKDLNKIVKAEKKLDNHVEREQCIQEIVSEGYLTDINIKDDEINIEVDFYADFYLNDDYPITQDNVTYKENTPLGVSNVINSSG